MEPIIPNPEERAKLHAEWHEQTFEKIKFEPKPREFLPRILYTMNRIWGDREVARRALRLFFWGCLIFLFVTSIYFYYGDTPMPGFTIVSRVAAGIFLLAVIMNFVVEFGWRGGKEIDKSHM